MRIHSDTLTPEQIYTAGNRASVAGHGSVYVHTLTYHGSRKRSGAWEVLLSGDGSVQRHRMMGDRDEYAASFDSWGEFLAVVFHYDPRAVAGPYNGADDFQRQTANAYRIPAHIL